MDVLKQHARLERLLNGNYDYAKRYKAINDGNMDDLKKRRELHRFCVHAIIVQKMSARIIENSFDNAKFMKRKFERTQKNVVDQDIYNTVIQEHTTIIKRLNDLRIQSGRWFLEMDSFMNQIKVKLTDNELRTALSITDEDWYGFNDDPNIKERDMAWALFICMIGDPAASNQVIEACRYEYKQNAKLRQKFHWKSASLFRF